MAAINLIQHRPDFFAVEHLALIEPIQTWLERFDQRALGFVFLQRRERRAKTDNRIAQCLALDSAREEPQFFGPQIDRHVDRIGDRV